MNPQDHAEGRTDTPLSKKSLVMVSGGTLVAASLIAVLFVLPAQFQIDPTGFGKLTGLLKLGTPQAKVIEAVAPSSAVHFSNRPYRTDTIHIALSPSGSAGSELEYKVHMKTGDSIVYSWTSDAKPSDESFYFDFHGETPTKPPAQPVVVEYRQQTGVQSHGALTAPIDGVHGWYFLNDALGPAIVTLHLSGFYDLVPPGEYGNESRIVTD